MNTLENVITDLQKSIKRQNNDLILYGKHSLEFITSRIVLTTKVETLVISDFINDYNFSMNDNNEILALSLKMGGYTIRIYGNTTQYLE